jgi:hypothetical protein
MAIRYTVRATVVDVRTDAPRATDRFFVDTNAWAWRHYPTCGITPTGHRVPQATEYPPYLILAERAGAVFYRAGSCFAELAHLVERTEHAAYEAGVGRVPLKEYRHNLPAERVRVVGELRKAWSRVKADGVLLPSPLDDAVCDAMMARCDAEPVDGYDLFALEAMLANGVKQILSDDGDFACVAGVALFTANPRVIDAARAQGALAVR